MKPRIFVITGGPCTGKSTVINEIARLGYRIIPEAARVVIAEQQKIKNGKLPWNDRDGYQKLVLRRQLDDLKGVSGIVFLERGLHDALAYYKLDNLKPPHEIVAAARNASYERVFLMEPIPFYEKDNERREDAETRDRIHAAIIDVYVRHGYNLFSVPFMQPAERAGLILNEARIHIEKAMTIRPSAQQ
jgi:predicted ATPase